MYTTEYEIISVTGKKMPNTKTTVRSITSYSVLRQIAMDVNTRSQNAVQASAQRKFYQWVLKWINATGDEDQHPAKLDVPVLASFLQAVGFKLISFEKHSDPSVPNRNEADTEEQKGTVRIAIECDASKMKAVLELGEIACQCPKPDHLKEASFWSVSGTGPTASTDNIVRKVEETGSNLLPRLSKDVTRVLRDVSYKLFDTISNEPDVNRNIQNNLNSSLNNLPDAKKDTGMIRSYTQPEIRLHTPNSSVKNLLGAPIAKNNSSSSINSAVSPTPSTLQRQKTWDIETDAEPRPSPPKVSSSPILELYTSLGHVSLEDENVNPATAVDFIIGAQQNLDKALQMLVVKKPTLERQMTHDLSPNQDNDGASVKSAPPVVSPTAGPYRPARLGTVTNIKPALKLSHVISEQARKISGTITSVGRSKVEMTRSKSTTRLNKLPQNSLLSRRTSLYSPSPTNSTTSLKSSEQKLSTRRSISRPNLTVDTSSRSSTKKVSSPVQQTVYDFTKLQPTNNRASLLKQPTKVSKAIPIKTNSSSKINAGSATKAKD